MRRYYTILMVLTLLSFVMTAVFLCILPDTVPAHYNFAGEIDRVGSKYETLIFPAETLGMALFMGLFARGQGKKGDARNEKVLVTTGIIVVASFDVMQFYFLWKDWKYQPGQAGLDDLWRFACIGIGAMLILMGNLMPKATRNTAFGLRTAWSMKDDVSWQKSQRIGGILSVFWGVLFLLCGVLLHGKASLIAGIALYLLWFGSLLWASWLVCQKKTSA